VPGPTDAMYGTFFSSHVLRQKANALSCCNETRTQHWLVTLQQTSMGEDACIFEHMKLFLSIDVQYHFNYNLLRFKSQTSTLSEGLSQSC